MLRRVYRTLNLGCLRNTSLWMVHSNMLEPNILAIARCCSTMNASCNPNAKCENEGPFWDAPKQPVESGFFQRVDRARLEQLKNRYKREHESAAFGRSESKAKPEAPKKK